MKIIKTVLQLQKVLSKERALGKSIGFTPTMGALHKGHYSLVTRMMQENEIGVVSIFVNPTQFGEASDLKKYPRTLKADAALLSKSGVQYIFAPSVEEVYPKKGKKKKLKLDLKGLDSKMEGEFRPGHFAGVCQVVKRLLDIVEPDALYMGQKDFQQFSIINHMLRTLKIPTKLVVCDIIREPHGLAMSSRNERLTKDHRKRAAVIYKMLQWIKRNKNKYSPAVLKKRGMEKITIPGFRPEYVAIVNGDRLTSVRKMDSHDYVVACVAVWAGDIRLIDNIIIKK